MPPKLTKGVTLTRTVITSQRNAALDRVARRRVPVGQRSPSPHRRRLPDPDARPSTAAIAKARQEQPKRVQLPLSWRTKNEERWRKAARRRAKFQKKVGKDIAPGLLEQLAFSAEAEKTYTRALEDFIKFAARHELKTRDGKDLALSLSRYADALFLDGYGAGQGELLCAAVEWKHIEFSRNGRLSLPHLRRALQGWRRHAPVRRRLPMPEPAMFAMTGALLARRHTDAALINVLSFSCYLRPSEGLGVMTMDLVEAAPEYGDLRGTPVLLLAPFERLRPTKTGVFDQVVLLNDTAIPGLNDALFWWKGSVLRRKGLSAPTDPGNVKMWDLHPAEYLKQWRQAAADCGLSQFAESPYQNRHGGASRDRARRLRTPEEGQRRGRWAAASSMDWYDKPGRVQELVGKMSMAIKDYAAATATDARFFLSLYGGVSACAKASARLGVTACVLDTAHNKVNDVATPAASKDIECVLQCL